MHVRMLVTTKTGDSRNVHFEIDGDYSDEKFDEVRESFTLGDLLVDRDHLGRVTWRISLGEIESTRYFYENDGDDITDW